MGIPRRWPMLLLLGFLLASGARAGLAPGKFKFTHVQTGRSNCGSFQGLLAAQDCDRTGIASLWSKDTGDGKQQWTVTPVGGGSTIEGVSVTLQVGGRSSCGDYLTVNGACTPTIRLKPKMSDSARQQWRLEAVAEGGYAIRSVSCPGLTLAYRKACATRYALLLPDGKGLYRWSLSAPTPPPSDGGGQTKVLVTCTKSSDWGSGWEGSINIRNDNSYRVLNWKLQFTFSGTFTWGPGDVDLVKVGSQYTMTPKDWSKVIAAGDTLVIKFGGAGGDPPSNLVFTQILPLIDPDNDPSLSLRGEFGAKVFSPYIDILAYPTPQLQTTIDATGQLFYTLAFITAKGTKPAWGGMVDLDDQFFYDQIRDLRMQGGDVIVSFGGANGIELAQAITDVPTLVAAYQSVIDLYKLRWVDFDIEGGAVADKASVDRRNQAIKILQGNNPTVTFSYCLPVLPMGLTLDGVALLANTKQHGVRVDVLQIMAMDFGDSAAPNPSVVGMGTYAIQAAQNTYKQAQEVGLDTKIGLIPMIGVNDVLSEVFTLKDACNVVNFAASTPWMRSTSFWAIGRDNFKGFVGATPDSSGIEQQPYDFTKAFKKQSCSAQAWESTPPLAPISSSANNTIAHPFQKAAFAHNWESWSSTYPGFDKQDAN